MNDLYLCHHGIKGQKWGVKNGPPYPIESGQSERYYTVENLKGSRVSNLDKWGKDAEHNVLFIVGYSGSGKSTTALGLKKPGDSVIHLDNFIEGNYDPKKRDPKFVSYLDRNIPDWKELSESAANKSKVKHFSKEYWKLVDEFVGAIHSFGIEEFKKGHRVITEGVQISDDWWGDKTQLKEKPMIFLQTSAFKAMSRAYNRDVGESILKELRTPRRVLEYVKRYSNAHKLVKDLADSVDAKRGKKYIEELLKM